MASVTITEEKSDVPAKGTISCIHLPPSLSQESDQDVQPMTSHKLNELQKGYRLNGPVNRDKNLVLTKVVPSDKNSRSHETSTHSEGKQSKHKKSERSTGDIRFQPQQTVATSKDKFTTTKNKNLHLRPSKSSSEFAKVKIETMPHSQSYSGDSGDTPSDLSRQNSILETDNISIDNIQNKEESQSQTGILFLNPHRSQQSELEQYSKEEGKQSQIQQEQAQHEQNQHEHNQTQEHLLHLQPEQPLNLKQSSYETSQQQMHQDSGQRQQHLSSEFAKVKKETMPHSQSYSGDSGDTPTDLSRQNSILETDNTSTDSIQNKEESQSQSGILFLNLHRSQQSELEQYSKEEGKQSQIQQEQAQQEQNQHEHNQTQEHLLHLQPEQPLNLKQRSYETSQQQMHQDSGQRQQHLSSEFAKVKKETMPHSQSYSGDSGDTPTDLSRQNSILETDNTSTDSIQNKEESQSQSGILFLNLHRSQQSELEQYSKEEGKQSQIQQEQAQQEQNQHEHNQTQEHLLHLQPEQPLNLKQSSCETSQKQMHQDSGQRQQHLPPKQYQQAQQQEQLQSSNEQHPQHQQHEGFVNNDQGSCLNPSLFTCTSPIKDSYSKWLQQQWRNTKITSFEDHQHPSEQKELPDLPTVTALSNTAQPSDSLLEIKRCPVLSESNNAYLRNSSNEKKSPSSFSSSLSAAKASSTVTSAESCTDDIQPSIPPTSPRKDCRQELTPTDLSVTFSSSVTDTSPEVDYVSMTSSALSMQSSASTHFSSTQSTISPMDSCSGDSHQPTNKRRDFVLLFPGDDHEEAQNYADHLKTVCKQEFRDLTVDLFSDIDSGQTAFKSSETLHDRYHHILILGNKNLADDHFARFLHENILTTGLRDANGKEYRVVPVWTCVECKSLIREFGCIKGFEYFRYLSDPSSSLANSYMRSVLNAVRKGRGKLK